MSSFKGLPPEPYMTTEPGMTRTRMILIITGLYALVVSEADVKKLIRDWRAKTGVDEPVEETFKQTIIRIWRREPLGKKGEIHCLVEMDKDQTVYTAHFH